LFLGKFSSLEHCWWSQN